MALAQRRRSEYDRTRLAQRAAPASAARESTPPARPRTAERSTATWPRTSTGKVVRPHRQSFRVDVNRERGETFARPNAKPMDPEVVEHHKKVRQRCRIGTASIESNPPLFESQASVRRRQSPSRPPAGPQQTPRDQPRTPQVLRTRQTSQTEP